jgi:uncharacterized protein YodC (DUF2158 family)
MSGDNLPDSRIGPIGPMYITDFLVYLKARNQTSFGVVLAAIETVRSYGPAMIQAERIADGEYKFRVHIGYGLNAVVEMERDKTGKLQPVFGEIVNR